MKKTLDGKALASQQGVFIRNAKFGWWRKFEVTKMYFVTWFINFRLQLTGDALICLLLTKQTLQ